MKIWFDISNSPHVNMFYTLINDLRSMGHQVVISSRPLANTIQLLDKVGLHHTVVGDHYGKNIVKKIFGFPIRIIQLLNYLKKEKPDIAVSQSSFHSPLTSWIYGIPSLYTNDNEHALGNYIAFPFATKILLPQCMETKNLPFYRYFSKKIITYPGIKEGIYLWSKNSSLLPKKLKTNPRKWNIYIRPEPRTAQYYNEKKNTLDALILDLQCEANLTILCRDAVQFKHYNDSKFNQINVPDKPISFDLIASTCDLFIGAGGSMTRELAFVGIPTISVYQSKLLSVDKYLLDRGWLIHDPDLSKNRIVHLIDAIPKKNREDFIENGKNAYRLLLQEVLRLN